MKRSGWWKAYFFFAIALGLTELVVRVFFVAPTSWFDWVSFPFYSMQVVGLFGFVYWRRIVSVRTWQLMFIATVGYEAFFFYKVAVNPGLQVLLQTVYTAGVSALSILANVTFGVFILLLLRAPLWVGLYLYAFRSRDMWRDAT